MGSRSQGHNFPGRKNNRQWRVTYSYGTYSNGVWVDSEAHADVLRAEYEGAGYQVQVHPFDGYRGRRRIRYGNRS
jgi:hypothetical protein